MPTVGEKFVFSWYFTKKICFFLQLFDFYKRMVYNKKQKERKTEKGKRWRTNFI